MRDGAPAQVYASVAGWRPHIASYRGDTLLAESVPVIGGNATGAVGQQVPEQVTFTVPRFTPALHGRRGRMDWMPRTPYDPLAKHGVVLHVSIEVESSITGASESGRWDTRVGTYRVHDWDSDGDTVTVTAQGMLLAALEDRFVVPHSTTGGMLSAELRRILPPGMGVTIDPALADRRCPDMSFGDDRIDALYEIADAWPARLRTDPYGNLALLPPLPTTPTPVLSLTDGHETVFVGKRHEVVIGTSYSDTRAGVYNRVVTRGQEADTVDVPSVWAVAEVTEGPMSVHGPYGAVTLYHASPLYTSYGLAAKGAQTRLETVTRAARSLPVQAAPDNRIELDDPVEVISGGVRSWGYVTGYDLPLTVGDGPMRLDVGVATA